MTSDIIWLVSLSPLSVLAFNVYEPIWGKNKPDAVIVRLGKLFATVTVLMGFLSSPFLMYAGTGLFAWLQTVNSFFNVPIFTII